MVEVPSMVSWPGKMIWAKLKKGDNDEPVASRPPPAETPAEMYVYWIIAFRLQRDPSRYISTEADGLLPAVFVEHFGETWKGGQMTLSWQQRA